MTKVDVDELGVHAFRTPAFVPRRYRPGGLGNWSGHLAFASDLILAMQPKLLVELGTHWGESYFGFCQAVADNGLQCLCYAVDHWHGERHSEEYGEEVYNDVCQHNDTYYKPFSYLVRSDFDSALTQFSDDSIDILHIDGLHTYEACSHDFWGWLPKIKPGGIVLLHDICARHADFGLWHLWEEIKEQFTDTFEFRHSWGLGIVRKSGGADGSDFLRALFHSTPAGQEHIRRYYSTYASHLENLLLRGGGVAREANSSDLYGSPSLVRVRICSGTPDDMSAMIAVDRTIAAGKWESISYTSQTADSLFLVIPSDRPSFIEISDISLYSATGMLLSRFSGAAASACFSLSGTIAPFHDSQRCLLIAYGDHPRLTVLPAFEGEVITRVDVMMRVDLMDALSPALSSFILGFEAKQQQKTFGLESQANAAQAQLRAAKAEVEVLREKLADIEGQIDSLRRQMQSERAIRQGMEHSKSWRLTAPLRRIMESLRGSH